MVQPLVTSGGRIALACAPPTLAGLLVAMVHLHVLARPDEVMNCSPASDTTSRETMVIELGHEPLDNETFSAHLRTNLYAPGWQLRLSSARSQGEVIDQGALNRVIHVDAPVAWLSDSGRDLLRFELQSPDGRTRCIAEQDSAQVVWSASKLSRSDSAGGWRWIPTRTGPVAFSPPLSVDERSISSFWPHTE